MKLALALAVIAIPFVPHAAFAAKHEAYVSALKPLTQPSPTLEEKISGKARVWVFLSAKCPCSHSHVRKIQTAFRDYSGKGVEFVGVHSNQDEPESLARAYFKDLNLGFPVYRDVGARVANRLGALKTPHIYVERPGEGIVYQGGVDESKTADSTETNYLRDALAEVLAGRPVSRPRTRTLGCAISRG